MEPLVKLQKQCGDVIQEYEELCYITETRESFKHI